MKNLALFFLVIALTLTGNISYAQNSILAGKIVDEYNKPIAGAIIRISKFDRVIQEITADPDGLYYSRLLNDATYHVDVVAFGKFFKAKKLFVYATPGVKKYYIIKLVDDKAVITKVDIDPANKTAENVDYRHEILDRDNNVGIFYLDTASGKYSKYSRGGEMPRMK